MKIEPNIILSIDDNEFSNKLFHTLEAISTTWSQRKAAKQLNISPQVLNRRILNAEKILNMQLVESTPRGSELTSDGMEILREYQKYKNKIKPIKRNVIAGGHISSALINTLAEKYGLNSVVYHSDDKSAFYLAKKQIISIMTLDDPLIAFQNDLELTPIAFDYLVLISSPNTKEINTLQDLNNANFISVASSSQRLAWRTLKNNKIKYDIIQEVRSPYEAYKLVKNGKNLHTFLNASYFEGNKILRNETKHAISLVRYDDNNSEIDEFMKFIFSTGQQIIRKEGFEPINL
jgi:molybdate transport repressor ModE-like protein